MVQDRLWESIDKEWMDTLCSESVENLLKLPSGVVQVNALYMLATSILWYKFVLNTNLEELI